MDWRWRGRSARPSLQRTSKASTKGAVKEAAMVKLPLLCSELVLQAMKVIFSGRQGKSADGWSSSLAQKSVGTYNWLMHIPHLSQHGSGRGAGCAQKKKKENTLVSLWNSPNSLHWCWPRPHPLLSPPLSLPGCKCVVSTGCWGPRGPASCCCRRCWYHIYWLDSVGEEQHSEPYLDLWFLKGFHQILSGVFVSSTSFVSLGGKQKVSSCWFVITVS